MRLEKQRAARRQMSMSRTRRKEMRSLSTMRDNKRRRGRASKREI